MATPDQMWRLEAELANSPGEDRLRQGGDLLAQGPEAYEPDRGNGRKTGRLIPNLATSDDVVVRDEMRGDNAPSVTDRFEDILGLRLESGPVDG